jgi:hypothetical protein
MPGPLRGFLLSEELLRLDKNALRSDSLFGLIAKPPRCSGGGNRGKTADQKKVFGICC